jgi:hypothetical protein
VSIQKAFLVNKSKEISDFFSAPLKQVDMNKVIQTAIQKNDERILEIQERQLDAGIGGDGKSLGRYKNFNYKKRWQPVDLKLEGDFRKKRTLTAGEKSAELFSQDYKDDILVKKYGKIIHEITSQNKVIVAELIKEDSQAEYKNQLEKV